MKTLNNLIVDIYDSAQYCSVPEFSEYALSRFGKTVQFNSAVIVDLAVTPDREFFIQSLHFQGTPIDRFEDRRQIFGAEKFDSNGLINTRDLALKSAYMHRGKSAITDIASTFHDVDILTYCKKYETAHSLTFVSGQASTSTLSTVSFGRAARKNAYTARQRHAADIVLPHILQARKINRELRAGARANRPGGSTALANFEGCLLFVEDKAIELFQSEWKQWTPPLLPPQLIDALKIDKESRFVGVSIQVQASIQGNMICLVVTANGRQKTAVSAAEYRVARLAVEGMQYKEIAKKLGVSPATVRNQLHSAYQKLGVTNKTALASALSAELPL